MLLRQSKAFNAVLIVLDIAFYSENAEPVSASNIAKRTSISRRTIEPILQALTKAKILKSTRGPNGGYKLLNQSVTLKKVIEHSPIPPSNKKEEIQSGVLFSDILLPFWQECDKKMLNYLDEVTIVDFIKKAHRLGIKRLRQYPLTFSI